jgi:multiple sugar transport system substrate-binding protein
MREKLLILVLIITFALTACGGKATTAPPAQIVPTNTTVSANPPSSGEKVTIKMWSHSNPAFQKANELLIAKFQEQNPNIEVKFETFEYDLYLQNLETSMVAGTEADVMELFGTWICPQYASGGRLMPVPEDVMTYDQAKQIFYQATLDGYYCDGKLYGLPHEFNLENGGALVNQEMFEKAGLAFPPKWASFTDLIADAKKMTVVDGGTMTVAGFDPITGDGLTFTFLAAILEQGGNYFAADNRHFNFDTPEARKALQMIVDWAQKDKVVDPVVFTDESNSVSTAFWTNIMAIGFIGSWAAGEGLISYPDFKFDYVEIPTYFGGERHFAADSGWGKVVSINTKHPAEAWKLAKFLTAEEDNAVIYNTTSGTIPALKALVENPDQVLAKEPWIKPTFDLLPHGQFIGNVTDRDRLFYTIVYPTVLLAMQGGTSVDEAVTKINSDANAMVDEAIK